MERDNTAKFMHEKKNIREEQNEMHYKKIIYFNFYLFSWLPCRPYKIDLLPLLIDAIANNFFPFRYLLAFLTGSFRTSYLFETPNF